jgi:hypothetical protein
MPNMSSIKILASCDMDDASFMALIMLAWASIFAASTFSLSIPPRGEWSSFRIAVLFESELDLVPFLHTLELLEAMHAHDILVLIVFLVRSVHVVHLAKKMAMHQYDNNKFT